LLVNSLILDAALDSRSVLQVFQSKQGHTTVPPPKLGDLGIIETVPSCAVCCLRSATARQVCLLRASSGCFKNSALLRSLLSGQRFTFVLFYKWELFAFLLRCVLIFTEARVLYITAFNYVCFVKTAGIMAASHFCSFSASDRDYLWTAAFLELLLCADQPDL